jgi:hypothetical protein
MQGKVSSPFVFYTFNQETTDVTVHVAAEILHKSVKGRIFTGSHCEYIKLCSINAVPGCSNGYKFVIKEKSGVRKQFLIMDGTAILAFVKKGKGNGFTTCTAYTEVTMSVDCKVSNGPALPLLLRR